MGREKQCGEGGSTAVRDRGGEDLEELSEREGGCREQD